MLKVNDEYRTIAKEYKKKFGYGVPLSMIPQSEEIDNLIRNIKECIKNGNDDLLERYEVQVDNTDVLY